MRTYTVIHPSGVTWTTDNLDAATFVTGALGFTPTPDPDNPVGVDCTAAKTKADLQAYADSLLIPGVNVSQTRPQMEASITAFHLERT